MFPTRHTSSIRRVRRRRAFTLIEALVAIALMVAVMLAIARVFEMTSLASGRTIGQSETVEAAATFEQAVRTQIARIKSDSPDSLLVIESPTPLTDQYETADGAPVFSMRHDRLVFIAQHNEPEGFRSLTDRSIPSNNPPIGPGAGQDRLTFSSPEALIYFGPGDPDGRGLLNAPAKDWLISQRIVLLGARRPAPATPRFTSFSGDVPPVQYPLFPGMSVYPALLRCGIDAVEETSDELVTRVALNPINSSPGLWDLTVCPTSVTVSDPTDPAFYGRAAFNLVPRIADLRIEWTDGSAVDPRPAVGGGLQNPATQWFGQNRDTVGNRGFLRPRDPSGPSGDVCSKREWLWQFDPVPPGPVLPESAPTAFGHPVVGTLGQIETEGVNAYRAVWNRGTWAFRPKALRFTFRVYDSQNHLSETDTYNQTPWAAIPTWLSPNDPRTRGGRVRRYGLEYSFVVRLPGAS